MSWFELLLVGSVVYAVGTGKVKDINSAARLLGQFVGRAAGGARRLRATATEMATRATLQPGVADSTRALRESMAQFRAVQVEAKSAISISGNRAFFQHQVQQRFTAPGLQGRVSDGSDAPFSDAELLDALRGAGGLVSAPVSEVSSTSRVDDSKGAQHAQATSPSANDLDTAASSLADIVARVNPGPQADGASHGHTGGVASPVAGMGSFSQIHPAMVPSSARSEPRESGAVAHLCDALDAERRQRADDESIF